MKYLISLLLFCGSAMAQVAPIEVAQECVSQMSLGICFVRPDRSQIAPGQTMLLSHVGRVNALAYQDYMDLYNEQVPTDPAMCDLALHYMTNAPGGDHDKIARALWTPLPKVDPKPDPATIAAAVIGVAMGVAAAVMAYMANKKVSA
jgi:hypothetical protein